jgi:hypothetical protein
MPKLGMRLVRLIKPFSILTVALAFPFAISAVPAQASSGCFEPSPNPRHQRRSRKRSAISLTLGLSSPAEKPARARSLLSWSN